VSPDLFVRPATAGDEHAITDIQLAAWTAAGIVGPDVLALLDPQAMRTSWHAAITAPPGPAYHVLVACDGSRVVAFASVMPHGQVLTDPEPCDPTADLAPTSPAGGLILAFEVAPDEQRSGHGSRLLAAVVDVLRTDGATEVSTWVLHGDDARTRFFAGAGLGPDGAQRLLTERTAPDDRPTLTESRWSATI